jgi:hypothetical protein
MHCHVLVHDAFWPLQEATDALSGLAVETLETLIARGRREVSPAVVPERWLLQSFGVERQGDWPAAPYCLLADGRAAGVLPGEDCWMRADPVHLRLEGTELLLVCGNACAVKDEEAQMLARDINSHFAGSFTLMAQHPERWYLRLASAPDMQTEPLASVSGRSITAHLPRGVDAIRWQGVTNELQMLLHEHPVNTAREARGEPAINSVWLWGAGRAAQPQSKPYRLVLANDPLACGLAQASGAEAAPLPENAGAWLDRESESGIVLLVLDALRESSCRADAPAWRDRLIGLDRDWFAPLARSLRQHRIGMITLHLLGARRTLHVEAIGADMRRFWRRRKPLATWAG